jgi:hypothetical protein
MVFVQYGVHEPSVVAVTPEGNPESVKVVSLGALLPGARAKVVVMGIEPAEGFFTEAPAGRVST